VNYHLLYIEPGTGTYMLQAIIAAVLGAVFWLKSSWQRFRQKQSVVVYSESRYYYQYFERLINDLLARDVKILYITSDKTDPLLKTSPSHMKVMYNKWKIGFVFSKMKADVMLMTMPDLGNYFLKRSPTVGKYIYVFHAGVSTHQQYRKEAFFNYDTIFCTGNYQVNEIRKAEQLYHKQPKELLHYGYPLLETIQKETHADTRNVILIAPSWFEGCIFDTYIEDLLTALSDLPYEVVLRAHPEYVKRKPESYGRVQKIMSAHPQMMLDEEADLVKTLSVTDILITDRSGIAIEFAMGVGKPVLFVDTVLKETNADWRELGIDPIENKLRPELGISISPHEINILPQKIEQLLQLNEGFAERMKKLSAEVFFNSEASYKSGVDYIIQQIQSK
jgi:hypothetical protein